MTISAPTSKRTAIVSGRYPATKFESAANHRFYCSKHQYTYIHANWPTGLKNRYMNKIAYLLEYLPFFDHLLWIDDDAFFIDTEKSLENFYPSGDSLITICESPTFKKLKTPFNSGVFMVRSSQDSYDFLQAVKEVDLDMVRQWWSKDLGFFSNGDQDAMYYLLQEDERFKGRYVTRPYQQFNSRYENFDGVDEHDVFICHFTGTGPVKEANYLAAQKKLNRSRTLLKPDEEDQLFLVPKPFHRLRKKLGIR